MDNELNCGNCGYYQPHYIRWGKDYQQAASGHCGYPRLKLRYSDTRACPNWIPRPEK